MNIRKKKHSTFLSIQFRSWLLFLVLMCAMLLIVLLLSQVSGNDKWDYLDLSPIITTDDPISCKDLDMVFFPLSPEKELKYAVESDIPNDRVFVSLNGQNKGRYMSFPSDHRSNCLDTFAQEVGKALNVEDFELNYPLRLYTDMGIPISSSSDILDPASSRLVVLLLEEETWIWAGVKLGYTVSMNDNKTRLTTVSLSPKVFSITGFTSDEECDKLIHRLDNYRFVTSPEVHSNPGIYHHYRTSNTAYVTGSEISKDLQKRAQQITRLPYQNYVEELQVVRYLPGQYYKKHTDFFDQKPYSHDFSNGVSRLNKWINWAQRAITRLEKVEHDILMDPDEFMEGEEGPENVRCFEDIQPGEELYPSMKNDFQFAILRLMAKHEDLGNWKDWVHTNLQIKSDNMLITMVQQVSSAVPMVWRTWEKYATDNEPKLVYKEKIIQRNRHVTVFAYFSDIADGGQTSFPRASNYPPELDIEDQLRTWDGKDDIKNTPHWEVLRTDNPECERGLGVPSRKGNAAMFYNKIPGGEVDQMAYHAGCPPKTGIKWGGNLFAWNIDSGVGGRLWL